MSRESISNNNDLEMTRRETFRASGRRERERGEAEMAVASAIQMSNEVFSKSVVCVRAYGARS